MKEKGIVLFMIAILAAMVVAGFLGEEPPPMTTGTVVEKIHEPERSWVQMVVVPIRAGKVTTMLVVPYFHHVPEYWAVVVKEDARQGTIYLPRETGGGIEIGERYSASPADRFELPVEKRKATEEEIEDLGVLPATEN